MKVPYSSIRPRFPLKKVADARVAYYEDDRPTLRRLLPELEAALEGVGLGTYSDMGGLNAEWIAELHIHMGEADEGFDWSERSSSRKEGVTWLLAIDPELDDHRNDPRYLDLLKRLGLD